MIMYTTVTYLTFDFIINVIIFCFVFVGSVLVNPEVKLGHSFCSTNFLDLMFNFCCKTFSFVIFIVLPVTGFSR